MPVYFTSTPKPIKGSDYISQRTLCRRNKFLMEQLQNTSGHSEEASAIQTSKLAISIWDGKRHDILEKVGISPAVITPKNMAAMKVDLGMPWEKVKCMAL